MMIAMIAMIATVVEKVVYRMMMTIELDCCGGLK